jgi:hypothetical protein
MLPPRIEVRPTKNSLKWFKFSIGFLIVTFILPFIFLPLGFLEHYYYHSCISIVPLMIFSPILPTIMIYAIYDQMKRIPFLVVIYRDRIRFFYHRGFKEFTKDIVWGEVVELLPYDKIKDSRGQEIRLHYLEQKDMNLILKYIQKPELLDVQDVETIKNLDNAISWKYNQPEKNLTISKRSTLNIVGYIIYGLFFIPLAAIGIMVLVVGFIKIDLSSIAIGAGMSLVLIPLNILLIYQFIMSIRKKLFEVDRVGVRYFTERKTIFEFKWKDLKKVSNGRGRSTRWITFHPKIGKIRSLNDTEIDYDKVKEVFILIKDYCAYHGIPMYNTLGW